MELTGSEDDQIRFEQEIAEISSERDSIEKAHLTLMDEHEKLKAEMTRLHASLDAAETRARDAEEAARSLGSQADSYLRSELDRLQMELSSPSRHC
jgi:regulator of replication initiation timing